MLAGLLEDLVHAVVVVGRPAGLDAAQNLLSGLLAEEVVDLLGSGSGLGVGQVGIDSHRFGGRRFFGRSLLHGDGLGQGPGGHRKGGRPRLIGRIGSYGQAEGNLVMAVRAVLEGNPVRKSGNFRAGRRRNRQGQGLSLHRDIEGGRVQGQFLGGIVHRIRIRRRILFAGPEESQEGGRDGYQL